MKPQVNDTIRLLDSVPDESLSKGAIGTIVAVFAEPYEAYEVEFCDKNGATITQLALSSSQFVLVN